MPPSPGALPSRPLQWMVGHPAAKGHSIFSTSVFLLPCFWSLREGSTFQEEFAGEHCFRGNLCTMRWWLAALSLQKLSCKPKSFTQTNFWLAHWLIMDFVISKCDAWFPTGNAPLFDLDDCVDVARNATFIHWASHPLLFHDTSFQGTLTCPFLVYGSLWSTLVDRKTS